MPHAQLLAGRADGARPAEVRLGRGGAVPRASVPVSAEARDAVSRVPGRAVDDHLREVEGGDDFRVAARGSSAQTTAAASGSADRGRERRSPARVTTFAAP